MDATWGKGESKGQAVSSQPGGRGNAMPDAGASSSNQQYIRRINNDAREDEMEDNMHMVGNILGDLKNMAKDMGDEIGKQNKMLDRVNDKVLLIFFSFIYLELEFSFTYLCFFSVI